MTLNKNTARKVLLVDDDTLLRELLGLIVERHGYQLKKAENGQDAMCLVESFVPDLIVLDVMMPVMDGREFLTWFKALEDRKANILVLTSMSDPRLHKALYELGATKVATKPVSMRMLEQDICELIGDAGAQNFNKTNS